MRNATNNEGLKIENFNHAEGVLFTGLINLFGQYGAGHNKALTFKQVAKNLGVSAKLPRLRYVYNLFAPLYLSGAATSL